MPPKNKKQLEEEAKRLEQQQRKRQQQERRLQQQRRKYAAETIGTQLLLPVSNQLILDFMSKQSSFIFEKLKEVLAKEYPELKDERTVNQICKEMIYHMKNLGKLFHLGSNPKIQQNQSQFFKLRVVCGIILTTFVNNHPSISDKGTKNKADDENLVKKLLLSHSQSKSEGQQKIFSKDELLQLLSYFKEHYFDHFLVIHKSRSFPKREDQKCFYLYIASPSVEFNTVNTKFIDLSNNKSI